MVTVAVGVGVSKGTSVGPTVGVAVGLPRTNLGNGVEGALSAELSGLDVHAIREMRIETIPARAL